MSNAQIEITVEQTCVYQTQSLILELGMMATVSVHYDYDLKRVQCNYQLSWISIKEAATHKEDRSTEDRGANSSTPGEQVGIFWGERW